GEPRLSPGPVALSASRPGAIFETSSQSTRRSPMAMVDERKLFIEFWEQEAKTTSKVLSRIPEGSDYKPDARSRTAQTIAWQIVCEEKMIIESLESGKASWAPEPMPPSMKDVAAAFDAQSA